MRICFLALLAACATLQPPAAPRIPKDVSVHGDPRIDDYFWLREKDTKPVLDYLHAEADYTEKATAALAPLRDRLYAELLSHLQETDAEPPYREGGWLYGTRVEKGKQYPIHTRKRAEGAPEEPVLDVNALAEGKQFLSVRTLRPSDDGALLAFTTDETGFRQYELRVKELATGALGPERIPRVTSFTWGAGRALYYVIEEEVAKRPFRLYRHTAGAAQDELLFEERDPLFELRVTRSRDGSLIFVESTSHTASEVSCFGAGEAKPALRVLRPRAKDLEYYADRRGELLYLRTNDTGRNFRLVTTPVAGGPWKELVPHREDVLLEDFDVFQDHLVLWEREGGLPQVAVIDLRSGERHRVAFPEQAWEVSGGVNRVFDTHVLRFEYASLTTPHSVFDYDLGTRQRRLLKEQPVPGGYDPSRYEVLRLAAPAADGALVPISLVRKKGAHGPLLLDAYGAYGNSFPVDFDSGRLPLLDRGVTYAIAHVRGGAELGKKWHDQGRMMNKRNTFTDFISAAEFLISGGYTSPGALAITGGSAGGLTMGAVLNLRPELFRAAYLEVPFVDVLNTMLDESLPLTVTEFEEWGNPKVPAEYAYLRTYSPYDNLAARAYPAMLVRSSYNDSQVMYWEPAKYVARLRALKTDDHPLLFKIRMEPGGHGGASGRYDRLHDVAFMQAWLLQQWGLSP